MAGFDQRAFFLVYGGAHGPLGPLMVALTILGSGWTALPLVPLAWRSPARRFARALCAALLAQALLVWAIKLAVGRVRPWISLALPAPIGAPHDPSFPSGHAAGSFCVAAFLALALAAAKVGSPLLRATIAALAVLVAFLIAVSRVYLGAHFPGDVLAGALLGATVGSIGAAAYVADARRRG